MKASANPADKRVYEFDSFLLDEKQKVLLREGERVPLTPKALELLIVLVSNAGLVLDKEELMEIVWPETFVEEANLAVNISMLRKALGEMPDGGQYIGTLPKRGYRFAASVRTSASPAKLTAELETGQQQVAETRPILDWSQQRKSRARFRAFTSPWMAPRSGA